MGSAGLLHAASGEELYSKNCAMCHGKDGKPQGAIGKRLGVKDLTKSVASDSEIAALVIEGRKDEKGQLRMPAFKDKITAEEVKRLIPVVKASRK